MHVVAFSFLAASFTFLLFLKIGKTTLFVLSESRRLLYFVLVTGAKNNKFCVSYRCKKQHILHTCV